MSYPVDSIACCAAMLPRTCRSDLCSWPHTASVQETPERSCPEDKDVPGRGVVRSPMAPSYVSCAGQRSDSFFHTMNAKNKRSLAQFARWVRERSDV